MILNLFLVFFDLMFNFVQGLIERFLGILAFMMRNKIVLMFRIDQDFRIDPAVIEREGHVDLSHTLEIDE